MNFKDVAIKNFKNNFRKYKAYFLCSSFSIMIFFMFSSLLFNTSSQKKSVDTDVMNMIFMIALTSISLFAVYFINYAHLSFIKSRYKEFGVYLTLGMLQRDIQILILIENGVILISSFIVGLLTGVVFSRLFQMIVVHFCGGIVIKSMVN